MFRGILGIIPPVIMEPSHPDENENVDMGLFLRIPGSEGVVVPLQESPGDSVMGELAPLEQ